MRDARGSAVAPSHGYFGKVEIGSKIWKLPVEIFRTRLSSKYSENIWRNACVQVPSIWNLILFFGKFGSFKTAVSLLYRFAQSSSLSYHSVRICKDRLGINVSTQTERVFWNQESSKGPSWSYQVPGTSYQVQVSGKLLLLYCGLKPTKNISASWFT